MSRHHRAAGWANAARSARQRVAATLPAPCVECGRPVTADMPWDVGHLLSLALGGSIGAYGAAHRSCNRRKGGQLGAAMAKRPKSSRRTTEREARW